MEIKLELDNGFVILPLAEYERLKKIEEEAHELWRKKIANILKGED